MEKRSDRRQRRKADRGGTAGDDNAHQIMIHPSASVTALDGAPTRMGRGETPMSDDAIVRLDLLMFLRQGSFM